MDIHEFLVVFRWIIHTSRKTVFSANEYGTIGAVYADGKDAKVRITREYGVLTHIAAVLFLSDILAHG